MTGDVSRPLDLTLPQLRALAPARDVPAVLQCAGNRRLDLQAVAQTSGDPWDAGAIGHAVWTGLPLTRLLEAAGANLSALHVAFESADEIATERTPTRFGVSIPMRKALDEDVLLAWAMNGTPLRPEHGHPLRLIVPGFAGVRSPKWLTAIRVGDQPSDNPMQSRDYHLLPPDDDGDDPSRGFVINAMPVNAAIFSPVRGQTVPSGPTVVRGYAVASRPITRVDLTIDGGTNWRAADFDQPATLWSWTLWRCALDLPPGDHEIAVRAWDDAGQTQPAHARDVWNAKGYLCTAWHRVRVSVVSND